MSYSDLCVANERICVGCCLRTKGVKKNQIDSDLSKSTQDWKKAKDPVSYGVRLPVYVLPSGLCPNLIKKDKQVLCAVHPENNNGKECRPDYPNCYKEYLCETAQTFNKWTKAMQNEFKKFLKTAQADWYLYGNNMDSGKWLKLFRQNRR